jgi:hypothetical protein
MAERYGERVHPETVVLDIGRDVGALIIYTEPGLAGDEIEISPRGSAATPSASVTIIGGEVATLDWRRSP